MIRLCFLKLQLIYEPYGIKQTMSLQVFSSLELGGITKHLMTGPRETVSLFPLDLSVPLGFTSGNTEGLGEAKLIVSLGPSH